MDNPFGPAGTASYVLLTTYKKDGTAVGTAVWAALDDSRLYVWTETGSWKVKRLRRNPEVTLQPCSVAGKPRVPSYAVPAPYSTSRAAIGSGASSSASTGFRAG